jgi:hypothetical protein
VQPQSIPRRICLAILASALAALPVGAAAARQNQPVSGLRPAPEFLDLFAPRLHRDAYRALVSPLAVEELVRRLADDPQLQHPAGSWTVTSSSPVDAFGEAGTYHRFRLIRLYGSSRARVVRGPRIADNGTTLETWTLVSPYPDATLTQLEPGTLVLVLRVPQR